VTESSGRASPAHTSLKIVQAETTSQIAAARKLFIEYAESLGFSLRFQGFDEELANLPGEYTPPAGRLLLAYAAEPTPNTTGNAQDPAGCVALHPLEAGICEMKRLYVRPDFRGKGVGKELIHAILTAARAIGYTRMRLDTIEPIMKDAVRMYRALGFRVIESYRANPIAGALYMELQL
jgi:putative acetyltransferase